MNMNLNESLSLLAAEFRGLVGAVLSSVKHGQLTADEAVAVIDSEHKEYTQLVRATEALYLGTGGEPR